MGEVIRIREDIVASQDADGELDIEVEEGDEGDKEGEVEVRIEEGGSLIEIDEAGKSHDIPREKYYNATLADLQKKIAKTPTTKYSPEQILQAIRNNIKETERAIAYLNQTAPKGLNRLLRPLQSAKAQKRRQMLEDQMKRLRGMEGDH